ncbi:hypothetical protein BKA82DRAFT_4015936 [Pisolithus tinctorius]|nr:hypothetical protein BKA82DRAFT_4015936 [Pisolithus tinctorius]
MEWHTRLSANSGTRERFEVATRCTYFRERKSLQSADKSSSDDASAVRSGLVGQYIVDRLAEGDSVSMFGVMRRHQRASGRVENITDEQDVLDILKRSGVVLVYTSSADVIMIGTDVVNVDDEPRLDPEGATTKLNESLHHALPPICATTECHCTTRTLGPYVTPPPNVESILSAYNTPFDPREPTGFVVRSRADEQASFITNGEPIYILGVTELFDECERWLSSPKIQDTYTRLQKVIGVQMMVSRVVVKRWKTRYMRRSTSAVQAARIQEWEVAYKKGQQTVGVERRSVAQRCYYEWGEWVQYARERMLTLQRSIEGKGMFDDEGREVARRILATTTGLDVDRQPRKIGSIIRGRQSMMGADPELDSSSFCFDFEMLYLRLRYSRGNRYLRQMAIAIRGSTISFEQSTHRSKTYNEIDAQPLLSEGEDEGASLSRREGYATTSAEDNCAYKYEGFGLTYDG